MLVLLQAQAQVAHAELDAVHEHLDGEVRSPQRLRTAAMTSRTKRVRFSQFCGPVLVVAPVPEAGQEGVEQVVGAGVDLDAVEPAVGEPAGAVGVVLDQFLDVVDGQRSGGSSSCTSKTEGKVTGEAATRLAMVW